MGLRSWKEEFYPVSACEVAINNDPRTIIAHSLKKWQGLLPKNLKKHNVKFDGWAVMNKRSIPMRDYNVYIDSGSCSLCEKYYMYSPGGTACSACPLYKVRGRVPCTTRKRGEESSPYDAGSRSGPDPRPMIKWLKKALAVEIAKQKKRAKRVKR